MSTGGEEVHIGVTLERSDTPGILWASLPAHDVTVVSRGLI